MSSVSLERLGALRIAWIAVLSLGAWLSGTGAGLAAPRERPRQKVAILVGGSGEEPGPIDKDLFRGDFESLRKRLSSRGWSISIAFGSKPGLVRGSKPATGPRISTIVREGLAGARPGDQVLLFFHSHGLPGEPDWGQTTHSLVSEDRTESGEDSGFNLDSIGEDVRKAEARGARVALVDLSCYSGRTQAMAGPSCKLTLAARDYVSICSGRENENAFTRHFVALPPAGVDLDLESHFLQARAKDRGSVNLPKISSIQTPLDSEWEALLSDVDPLDIREQLKAFPYPEAKLVRRSWFDVKRFTQAIDRARSEAPRDQSEALASLRDRLRQKIESMLKSRKEIEELAIRIGRDHEVPDVELSPGGGAALRLTLAEFSDVWQAATSKDSKKASAAWPMARWDAVTRVKSDLEGIGSLMAPRLRDFEARLKAFESLSLVLETQAGELLAVERELYERLQPSARAKDDGCRAFKL